MNPLGTKVARTATGQSNLNTLTPPVVRLRLFDPFMNALPHAPYRIVLGEREVLGEADGNGWLEVRVSEIPERCFIEYGRVEQPEPRLVVPEQDAAGSSSSFRAGTGLADLSQPVEPDSPPPTTAATPPADESPDQPRTYLYDHELYLLVEADTDEETLERRLHNLGFGLWETLEQNRKAIERLYERSSTPTVAELLNETQQWHNQCQPKVVEPKDSRGV
jgi:hypothetical protein